MAALYHDLDQGFTPMNFMFPNVPFPANYRRDLAQAKMRKLFMRVIDERRRRTGVEYTDMLDSLMRSTYKSGEPVRAATAARAL